MKTFLFLSLLAGFFGFFAPVAKAENWNVDRGGLFSTGTDALIKGYDPVAYFTEGKPVKGSPQFQAEYKGAPFHFASAANRDLFNQNPEEYAPQYGGYCAWAVSQGYTADVDPESWKIVDGKLYLNNDRSIQQKWEKDIPGFIVKANANWPNLNK